MKSVKPIIHNQSWTRRRCLESLKSRVSGDVNEGSNTNLHKGVWMSMSLLCEIPIIEQAISRPSKASYKRTSPVPPRRGLLLSVQRTSAALRQSCEHLACLAQHQREADIKKTVCKKHGRFTSLTSMGFPTFHFKPSYLGFFSKTPLWLF